MYEEQEDHFSIDFHTGVSPEKHFCTVVNVIAFLMFLLIVFSVAVSYLYPLAEEQIYHLFGADYETYMAMMDVLDMFEYTCSFLLPLGITLLIFRDRVFRPYVPFRASMPEHAISAIFMTVAILFVFGFVTNQLLSILELIGIEVAQYETYLPDTPLRVFLYFLSSVVLPAFVEEMIFRGYILHMLLPYGKTFAIVLSAILFGMMHLYYPQILYAAIAGIFIGYFVVRSESIWIGILIHAVNNLFSFLLDMAYVMIENDDVYWMFCIGLESLVLVCGIIGALILFYNDAGKTNMQHLEINSGYSRLLDTPAALRRAMTIPMLAYLVLALYVTIQQSFFFGGAI